MRWVKRKVAKENFPTTAFAMAQAYSRWEIDEIVSYELLRNVTITTLLLLADFLSCFLVLLCLILTLVDVMGLMYFWGMSIDTVTGTNIIISVGLCVDYCAHIAHSFLTKTGSGIERMQQALTEMGPAVFNGGFSTLLAIVMLVNSKSWVFICFFRIFFLMIVVGLFHGLVLLPTALSIPCPEPYTHYTQIRGEQTHGIAMPANGVTKHILKK
jgi:predicted RND superfamily exporter protein